MIDYSILTNLEGWCSIEKAEKLYKLIKKIQPSTVVEIGVFAGKSLIIQACALKENNHGIIHGIDSWSNEDCIHGMTDKIHMNWWNNIDYQQIYDQCISAIHLYEVEKFIKIHKLSSQKFINSVDFEIDILHIDGNHEEYSSCHDVNFYIPKIKSGGYLWFDDAAWPQTQKAVSIIENHFKLELIDRAQSDDSNNFCNLYYKK